jgi:hypothetical protein
MRGELVPRSQVDSDGLAGDGGSAICRPVQSSGHLNEGSLLAHADVEELRV